MNFLNEVKRSKGDNATDVFWRMQIESDCHVIREHTPGAKAPFSKLIVKPWPTQKQQQKQRQKQIPTG
jgi:hypothetical protein